MSIKNLKYLFSATLSLLAFTGMKAQTYQLPGAHREEHSQLIARQQNMDHQIKSEDTQQLFDYLFKEEEEPEIDIFTEGWNSKSVNPFDEKDVPQTAIIDVSKFHMPHPGYVTSPYGYRKRFRRQHKGVDLKLFVGDTIRAAFDGKVRLTNFEKKGYGYYVILRHTNDLETVYGHLSKFLVEDGQTVKAGDPIALGGNTGRSTGPHLHFETRYMGYPINPEAIFDFANQTVHTDTYTFDKKTYQLARNFDPAANARYAEQFRKEYQDGQSAIARSTGAGKTVASSSAKSSKPGYYTVKNGDSLSRIASRNGTSIKNLCRLNNLKSDATLHPGQKLRIR